MTQRQGLFFLTLGAVAFGTTPSLAQTSESKENSAIHAVLPFPVGAAHQLLQGNNGPWGHSGRAAWAVDFKMPIGSPVTAALGGTVVAVQTRFADGNRTPGQENFVVIRHADGSFGRYYHLTKDGSSLVVGATVGQGQEIARSGDTGASAGPHLHFDVTTGCFEWGCQTVPVVFDNAEPPSFVQGATYTALPHTVEGDRDRVQLRLDTSEAEAVLAIVAKRRAGQPATEEDWGRLFATEPYQRLKKREAALQRAFTDESFQQFVLSEDLTGRAQDLRRTLDEWTATDLQASARRVLAYLPGEARIRAKVFPVIKPKTNSFVFEPKEDAAIFLYLNPELSPGKFENTVAHELHHIGFASVENQLESILDGLPDNVRPAVEWMGAFGEGFAMLAAAGDPDTHPHSLSPSQDRARWDRDMANFNQDLERLEAFFLDIIDGRLSAEDEIRERGFSFFGEQGPWYTVGYQMAAIIERHDGRAKLIECMIDPRRLLARYNAAASELNLTAGDERLALWSPQLLHPIGAD